MGGINGHVAACKVQPLGMRVIPPNDPVASIV